MSQGTERRSLERVTVAIAANVVSHGGLSRTPATIVNLSQAGAMLELSAPGPLPPSFELLYRRRIENCRLVWQRDGLAGVQFLAE